MNKSKQIKDRTFPFAWPWRGANNDRISLSDAFLSRKFSFSYMIIIWSIVGFLGFASTRNCTGSWQLALQCDYAFWVSNFTDAPLIFFRNLFTTMFLHNGLDHILFVSILGVVIIIQSYEVRFGFRETVFMFFLGHLIVGTFFGIFYQSGLRLWPESEFFLSAFERNWMGGSLGFFYMYGALASTGKKPWLLMSFVLVFESFNFFVLGIDSHISLMHSISAVAGFLAKRLLYENGETLRWSFAKTNTKS